MYSVNSLQEKLSDKPVVRVFIEKGDSAKKEYFFKDTFRIGRQRYLCCTN